MSKYLTGDGVLIGLTPYLPVPPPAETGGAHYEVCRVWTYQSSWNAE